MFHFGLILLLVVSSQCKFVDNIENVPDYLGHRLTETKIEIARSFIHKDVEPVVPLSYDIEWVKLWSKKLHSERTLMIGMSNKMCILEGNRVISVAVKPATNKTSSALQQVALIRQNRSVKFVKSIFWKSKLYLFICHEDDNVCELYTGKNDHHLRHRQIMKNNGWPTDAVFFIRADQLYLVVAHNTDQFPVSSLIYRWTGTYMDVIYRIVTIGAISVTAFDHEQSTIIIFGQNEKTQPDVGSGIYELHDSGIEIIQYLPTNGPVAIYHYAHKKDDFLIVVNEIEPSNVYWWDGNEFLPWIDVPNIVSPSIVHVAHFHGETLFFVSHENSVTLYKVSSSEYWRLDLLQLKNGERVVDMGVWMGDPETLTLLLVTVDPNNLYRIEPWELRIKKNPKNEKLIESNDYCLKELEARLYQRVDVVKNAVRHTWPLLHPSTKDGNVGPLRLKNLILQSGSIANIKISSNKGITWASEIKRAAHSSVNGTLLHSVVEQSRNIVKTRGNNRLVGNVIVRGNAVFREFQINNIHTKKLNGQSLDPVDSAISATKNQTFVNAHLVGKNVNVRHLHIDRLCGIPFDYWLRDANEPSNNIFLQNETPGIINDTIFIKTNLLSLDRLNVETINRVTLNSFFDDIFIPGQRQLIKGNVIQRQSENLLTIGDLSVRRLNGIAREHLMTTWTNQSLENNVFAKTISTEYLIVEKINGIAVSESAMVSNENHVKGQVTIAKLLITDEMTIENPSKLKNFRPVQVYDEVTIDGSLKTENVTFEPETNVVLSLKNSSTIKLTNVNSILDSYWTKSTDQTIHNEIYFDGGMTVDQLKLEYLNDLFVNTDIMTTDVREISDDFGSLEFTNFTAIGWINRVESIKDSTIVTTLWNTTDKFLNVNQQLRIKFLGAKNLKIGSFNGIPIDEIMKRNLTNKQPYEYPVDSIVTFDNVTVIESFQTEDLNFRFFNNEDVKPDDRDFLQSDGDYAINDLNTDSLTVHDTVFIDETNELSKLIKFMDYLDQIYRDSMKDFSLLSIDGNLIVKNNLQVVMINHQGTKTYLEDLVSQDFAVNSNDRMVIDDLVVHGDIAVNSIEGIEIEWLIGNTLSKFKPQNLTNSLFEIMNMSVDDLRTERINERYTNELIYTDFYDLNVDGDVTFTKLKLSLDDDTQTKSLNGYKLHTILTQLGEIPQRLIDNLTVSGNVSWDSLGSSLASKDSQFGPLEQIMTSCLVKHSKATQSIKGPILINSSEETSPGMFVRWMKYNGNNSDDSWGAVDMRKIVDDAVLDDPSKVEEIKIGGKKLFGENLTASRLDVVGEIGMKSLNKWNVDDLNDSIIRRESLSSKIGDKSSSSSLTNNDGQRVYRRATPSGNSIVFLEGVKIKKLVIARNDGVDSGSTDIPLIHGIPISAIVSTTNTHPVKYIPNNTWFGNLAIRENVVVKSLDNVDFDEFVVDRVTVNSNQEIHANVQFNGRVQVSQGAAIRTINGMQPSDFVVNDSNEAEIIFGEKIFHDDIEIIGNINAPWIAGINFKVEYDNGVFNNQDADIIGDVNFKSEISRSADNAGASTSWELNPVGRSDGSVNGMRLKSFLKNLNTQEDKIIRELKKNESILETSMARASKASMNLPKIFHYLESQDDLAINLARINRVAFRKNGEKTILNMYANELGSHCGLTNDCPCRRQYVAEITTAHCDYREIEGSTMVYHFQESKRGFDVTVMTNGVSSSDSCTVNRDDKLIDESTTISWTKRDTSGNYSATNFTELWKTEIEGYLSDVEIFTHNEFIFIILAIYYDPIERTHETNSWIFELNIETGEVNLTLLPTSRASGVHVFEIPSKGRHVLLMSSEATEFGKTSESMLYRFEASTSKLELLRIFTTGGTSHAKSVFQEEYSFLFIDDASTNSIHVYMYDERWDNFYLHQTLFHKTMAPITAIETFYADEFQRDRVYVIVTTKHDQFTVYEYMFTGKFQIIAQNEIDDILTMVPFVVSNRGYVFVGTETDSAIMRLIDQP